MPPKPRIPKPVPPIRPRSAPTKPGSRSPPNPSSKPHTPPHKPWYREFTFRTTGRYASYWALCVCGGLFLRDNYMWSTRVQGASMQPSINPSVHETGRKDWILVRPYLRKGSGRDGSASGEIQRGDVVTFWKPHSPESFGIKRVVGIEGDAVYVKEGYAMHPDAQRLMGVPDGLADEDPDAVTYGRAERGKVVVPYGHVWLEGDNARSSRDSRVEGPISKGLVEGKAVLIWRGWGQFMRVRDARSKKEKALGSRVVEGAAEVPTVFLD
jgi:inner membrane protease subunit 2